MREPDLRELAGLNPAPQIEVMGQTWALRPDGLAPMLRFSRADNRDNPEQGPSLAAVYRFFEDCIINFQGFSEAAFDTKAGEEEIASVIGQIAACYCARSHWAAWRLIGYVADNLEEMDGGLIRAGGRGVKYLSAREACNVALAACLEGREEEDRESFLMDLNYEGDAASEALAQLRAFQQDRAEAARGE
jgi:hypothetical protein